MAAAAGSLAAQESSSAAECELILVTGILRLRWKYIDKWCVLSIWKLHEHCIRLKLHEHCTRLSVSSLEKFRVFRGLGLGIGLGLGPTASVFETFLH